MSTNRFAVSALSRSRKEEALNDEIMIHKPIGQLLMKRPDGVIASHDSISRFNMHRKSLENNYANIGITGDLYVIELDNVDLPSEVQESTNILSTPVEISTGVNKLLLSLDLDCLEVVDGELVELIDYPDIKIDFSFVEEGEPSIDFSKVIPANKLSSTVIDLSKELVEDVEDMIATITSITIEPNPANENKTVEYFLHSILLIVE
jgi:hypothetical protein